MTRTQIYLTDEQRRILAKRARTEGVSVAEMIRRAVDEFIIRDRRPDAALALERTLGALPTLSVPGRAEWARGRR